MPSAGPSGGRTGLHGPATVAGGGAGAAERRLRVAVWSTGGIGSAAVRAVHRRRDLELAGVWTHTAEKDGRDAGELCGLGAIGIAATRDAESLLALRPDCVVYAASGPERDAAAVKDYLRMLAAGVNVVTTTSTMLVFPGVYPVEGREALEKAAADGGASLYASGIFPGFASDQLALALSTLSSSIARVRITEVSLNDHYPVASVMQDGMGFGRPLDFEPMLARPGVIGTVWRAPIALIAAGLGVDLEECSGVLDRALTTRDLDVAMGRIPAGTVGAVRTRASGIVAGREAIVVEHVIRMGRDVAPDWPGSGHDATYEVHVEGEPDLDLTLTTGAREGHGAGNSAMTATAMRVVNAVPYVVDAAPGLLSSLDLPLTLPRHALEENPCGL